MYLIRSACLTGYVDAARAAGLDPRLMMEASGLDPSCLRDPDTKIDVRSVRTLLQASATASGIADFGLRMAEGRRLSNLGPLSLVVREEPTVRKALEMLARYIRLHNEALFTRIEEARDLVIIREEIIVGETADLRQPMELAVGVLFRVLRELLGPEWEPRRVCFSHSAPATLANHVRVFGRFVEFGRDFNGIVCSSKELDAQIASADPQMARYAHQYLESILARPNATTSDKVRELVIVLLPSGRCSIKQLARHLDVDRRTVHRQLASEGETFSSIVGAVRKELAVRYIERDDRGLSDVADLLGFSAQSAFARWFRDAFGCTVTEWRRAHAARV